MGNKRFRERINATIKDYMDAPNRYEKSLVVHGVVEQIQASGGRFLKYDDKTGNWYELSNSQMKEKVGHAIRDAVNALEARVERKRMSEAKEDREPGASSPAPAASVRDKGSPSSTLCYQLNMPENNHVHSQQHFHQNPSQQAVFEPSQPMLYHQLSPSDPQRPFHYPPVSFQQRYRLLPRPEEYRHPSCLQDGAYPDHHHHHPNLIEPLPYAPASSESLKTGDLHQVVPSDASATADTGTCHDTGEEDEQASPPEKSGAGQECDPFLDQINKVLGPIVDDAEDSCLSV